MKRFMVLIPVMLLCLTGCNEKTSESLKCTLTTNDVISGYSVESEYVINYTGKLVDSVDTIEVVKSENKEILDSFETTLNDTYKKMNDVYGGYTYEVTRDDDKVSSKVTIDYSKMNVEQFVTDQPTMKSYVEDNKLTFEGIKSMYESMGATCE